MLNISEQITITTVTPENISETGIFCIKDKNSNGYKQKAEWFKLKINSGLQIKIATDEQKKQLGFIEFIPSELAWRPLKAKNYLFVQCIGLFAKDARNKNIGSALLQECEKEAIKNNYSGVCAITSDGPWMANKTLFEKNNYEIAGKLGRFELMFKAFNSRESKPALIDWTNKLKNYKGWHLIYSDQCPWHEKSVADLKASALKNGIDLKVKKLTCPEEAQNAPSGFGSFSLLKDGKLLGDHYLSKTRFENIVKQETK